MARAAEILTGRYTLVVTNVPFLARGKQDTALRKFAETRHGDAKGDIATVFVSRIFRWLGAHGTQAVVTPQNWLFLTTYRKLRERLLRERTWNVVARLGAARVCGCPSGRGVQRAGHPVGGRPCAGVADGGIGRVGSARPAPDSGRGEGRAVDRRRRGAGVRTGKATQKSGFPRSA